MKPLILFLLLTPALNADSQSLKDLLYSGKLKQDSSGVVRKTDDLSTRIDTTTKKPVEAEKPKTVTATEKAQTASAGADSTVKKQTATVAVENNTESEEVVEATEANVVSTPVKSNNKIWKEHTDALVLSMKGDIQNNKKIRKETYYLMVDYELAPDGSVEIINVTSSPENAVLQSLVKEHLMSEPPQMNPAANSSSQTKKSKRKFNFSLTKE